MGDACGGRQGIWQLPPYHWPYPQLPHTGPQAARCPNLNEGRPTLSATKVHRPLSPVSGNIGCYGYSQGFLLAGASNESWVVEDGNFWRFEWLLLRKLAEIRPAILYGDMVPLDGL